VAALDLGGPGSLHIDAPSPRACLIVWLMRAQPVAASADVAFTDVLGWQFTEQTGLAAAQVLLRETDANGPIVADIKLAAGESAGEAFTEALELAGGLFVDVELGAIRGAVYGR
jgi:hypothetical protein